MENIERPIRTPQLAEWLGISEQALAQMRHRGTGPAYIKKGHLVFYMPSDIQKWLDEGRTDKDA